MNGRRSISATTAAGTGAYSRILSASAVAFATKVRGISQATLAKLGAGSGTAYFPNLGRESEAVFFPYLIEGEEVNWKAAAFPDKDFVQKKGGKLAFFNLDAALAAIPGDVFFTEGEWDTAALVESGIAPDRVLSVPNGARSRHEENGDVDRAGYGFVEEALKAGLGKHKRFIWCGDMDAPGLGLRQDMARLLGQARFYFVDWPEGVKDANDLLRHDGRSALFDLVTEGMLPWPVAGLYRLNQIPEPAPLELWRIPGFPSWEGKIRLAPGTLSVVTGHPGHGKTILWGQIWHEIAQAKNLSIAVASFETRAKPHYRRLLRSLESGKREKEMSDEERSNADQWIDDHYLWINHPEQRPTLTWLLDMAEVAVVRHGAKVLLIDPWNRLESQRDPRESETDYIGRCLSSLYVFAQDMGCHAQVVAHPAKMEGGRKGRPPELDDIAGSKNWDNRVDQGFVVHRPKMFDGDKPCTAAILYQKKVRFDELGYPCRMDINYETARGCFVEGKKKEEE